MSREQTPDEIEAEARAKLRQLLSDRVELFVTPVEDGFRARLEASYNEQFEWVVGQLIVASIASADAAASNIDPDTNITFAAPAAGETRAAPTATVDDLFEIFAASRIDAATTDIPGGPLAFFEQAEAAKHQIITLLTGSEGGRESGEEYIVVRAGDLRWAVSAMDAIGTGPDDHDSYLRLRAKLKEQS